MSPNIPVSTGAVFPNFRRDNPDTTRVDERVKLVNRFFNESRQNQRRQTAVRWWQEADRLFNGEHWHDVGLRESWRASLTINLIYPVVEKYLSLAMSMVPKMEILPAEPEDHILAKSFDNFFMHEWERKNWLATFGMAIEKAIVRDVGFLKMFWDVHGDGGRGSIHLEAVSAYDLYLHPDAIVRDGALQTKYGIHVFRMTREQIIHKYGVDPSRPAQYRPTEFNREMTAVDGSGTSVSTREQQNPNLREMTAKDGSYDVYECWYNDDTRVETTEFDPPLDISGVPPLQYPHGRILTMANNTILYDGPNPLGFFPIVVLTPSPDPEVLYKRSLVNQLASPQYEYNKRRSQIADHASLVSNPPIEININSGIDADTPLNQPGRKFVNYGDGQHGIRVIEVPKLGPEVMQALTMAHQDVQEISGIYEVSRGEEPSGDQSGVAIERLQSEGKTRSNMRQMFLDQGLKTFARNAISMLLDFVSDSRKFMFVDSNAQVMFDEFNPIEMLMPRRLTRIQQIEAQIQEAERVKSLATLTGEGPEVIATIDQHIAQLHQEIQTVMQMPAHDLVSLDVKVSMGTRNMSKSQQISQAVQLHQTPSSTGFGVVIDDQALLEMLEVPGWPEILARQQQAAAVVAKEMQKIQKSVQSEKKEAAKK